jgi:hypothetical protein
MMTFKSVMRLDRRSNLVRLFRVMWDRGTVGDGKGYSNQFSVALRPAWFRWHRETDHWFVTVLGVRFHYARSWGGRFA